MKNLIKFELRKILTKRFALISIAAVLLLSLILSFSTLQGMNAFDGKNAEGSGKTAVEIDKQIAAKYEGILTDDKVQQIMTDFKPNYDLHGMNAKYLYTNAMQSAAFYHFSDMDGNWNGLTVSDVFGNEEIKVGYVNGWLILTSRYGKTKCATAKVMASLISAIFITLLVIAFNLVFAFLVYGNEGLDCSILFAPLEFSEGYIPFNITCGTVLKYQILLAFLSAIGVTGITLILSAVCKQPMIAFVVLAALHVMPMLLPISETNALYRIIVLSPLYYSQYISIMSVEQMKNGMLYAIWAVPVAIILAIVGSLISHRVFAKHQVS